MMRIENPADGSLIEEISPDDAGSVRRKVQAARAGQRLWAQRSYEQRAACIERFAAGVTQETESLARTLTMEVGKPIAQSNNELNALADRLRFFLDKTPAELAAEVLAGEETGTAEQIRFEPLGVVANVSAWNYPYFVGANVFVPALLTGNAVLYKPSEYAALTGRNIGRLLASAGVPEDVFTVVQGAGDVGAALVQADVDGVFFTGSYATGVKIAESAARRMLRVQLELGGKDPAYVCDDANVEGAAASLADGAFYNTGQSCCAVERIYVHDSIWRPFVDAFVKTVSGFVLGDPLSEQTYIGPLARREPALAHLEGQVKDAANKGAKILTGGKRGARPGFYFEPTVLVDVNHEMAVMRDESFGPVIGLMRVASDEEAMTLMADTPYGLTAAVYGQDVKRAETILSRLNVGSAYWNCCDRVSPRLPWSGRGHSGIGCTLSSYGIEAFLRPKAWHLRGPG